MAGRDTAYIGNQIFTGSDYYIHKHVENIGRAGGKSASDQGQLAAIFNAKKQDVSNAVKTQYKNLFKQSIVEGRTSPEGMAIINQALKKDDIMKEINDQMGKYLLQALSVDKMVKLMNHQMTFERIDFNKIINPRATVDIAEFSKLLQVLANASKLIKNRELGKRLAFYLSDTLKSSSGTINRATLGENLRQQLIAFDREAEGSVLNDFDIAQIKQIRSSLNTLVRGLKTGKTSKGKTLTADGAEQSARAIFNTGFAEAISGQIKKTAYVSIAGGIKNVKLTGADTTQIALTNTLGQFQKYIGDPSAGKADVIFPNLKIQLKEEGSKQFKQISINIGISDKFYKGAKFPGVSAIKEKSSKFSSGAGGKLTTILELIFGNDIRHLYLSYNVLAHGPKIPAAQQALEDIIVKRNLIYSFSARGTSDFAQFMFINGQIVSIWDIILSFENFVNKSNSILRSAAPVYWDNSDKNYKNMESLMNPSPGIENILNRVAQVNAAIKKVDVSIELNLKALKASGGKVFSRYS